ncbi:15-hydroxyprostaglandin dehydrogenase [NAD+] [Fusarium oxysporum f. sp. cubense race 1]|uniref:15-hydroxyprostaglandin dehydrogenase [NAD+] n=1 Tax=Fusarium oxysporum f. sp. cubense (strain race 1) TaxID=1229664 RepID=N4UQ03_FUSC1|nr:15-hydroxyprostaglandin dehydrogenase [NAD+] [Fusarium oxysporum f. sp. cubense race 1]
MPPYHISSPVNCDIDFNRDQIAGKVAIVTGGASGIGEAYVRALHSAGVVIGDKNATAGEKLASELTRSKFVQCDATVWEDQVRLYKEAAQLSSSGKIHYVIANAGTTKEDQTFTFDGKDQEPQKPDLQVIDVNLKGALYTSKLAMHYFVSQNDTEVNKEQEDTCLILISSGAGFLDVPRSPEYSTFYYGSRVNVIAPWYIRTGILSKAQFDQVEKSGVELATAEDAGECALRILSDTSINGRTLFVCARKWASRGYMDLNIEDYPEGLIQEIQEDQMRNAPVDLGLLP